MSGEWNIKNVDGGDGQQQINIDTGPNEDEQNINDDTAAGPNQDEQNINDDTGPNENEQNINDDTGDTGDNEEESEINDGGNESGENKNDESENEQKVVLQCAGGSDVGCPGDELKSFEICTFGNGQCDKYVHGPCGMKNASSNAPYQYRCRSHRAADSIMVHNDPSREQVIKQPNYQIIEGDQLNSQDTQMNEQLNEQLNFQQTSRIITFNKHRPRSQSLDSFPVTEKSYDTDGEKILKQRRYSYSSTSSASSSASKTSSSSTSSSTISNTDLIVRLAELMSNPDLYDCVAGRSYYNNKQHRDEVKIIDAALALSCIYSNSSIAPMNENQLTEQTPFVGAFTMMPTVFDGDCMIAALEISRSPSTFYSQIAHNQLSFECLPSSRPTLKQYILDVRLRMFEFANRYRSTLFPDTSAGGIGRFTTEDLDDFFKILPESFSHLNNDITAYVYAEMHNAEIVLVQPTEFLPTIDGKRHGRTIPYNYFKLKSNLHRPYQIVQPRHPQLHPDTDRCTLGVVHHSYAHSRTGHFSALVFTPSLMPLPIQLSNYPHDYPIFPIGIGDDDSIALYSPHISDECCFGRLFRGDITTANDTIVYDYIMVIGKAVLIKRGVVVKLQTWFLTCNVREKKLVPQTRLRVSMINDNNTKINLYHHRDNTNIEIKRKMLSAVKNEITTNLNEFCAANNITSTNRGDIHDFLFRRVESPPVESSLTFVLPNFLQDYQQDQAIEPDEEIELDAEQVEGRVADESPSGTDIEIEDEDVQIITKKNAGRRSQSIMDDDDGKKGKKGKTKPKEKNRPPISESESEPSTARRQSTRIKRKSLDSAASSASKGTSINLRQCSDNFRWLFSNELKELMKECGDDGTDINETKIKDFIKKKRIWTALAKPLKEHFSMSADAAKNIATQPPSVRRKNYDFNEYVDVQNIINSEQISSSKKTKSKPYPQFIKSKPYRQQLYDDIDDNDYIFSSSPLPPPAVGPRATRSSKQTTPASRKSTPVPQSRKSTPSASSRTSTPSSKSPVEQDSPMMMAILNRMDEMRQSFTNELNKMNEKIDATPRPVSAIVPSVDRDVRSRLATTIPRPRTSAQQFDPYPIPYDDEDLRQTPAISISKKRTPPTIPPSQLKKLRRVQPSKYMEDYDYDVDQQKENIAPKRNRIDHQKKNRVEKISKPKQMIDDEEIDDYDTEAEAAEIYSDDALNYDSETIFDSRTCKQRKNLVELCQYSGKQIPRKMVAEKKLAIVRYKRRYNRSPPPKQAYDIDQISPINRHQTISAPIPRRAAPSQIRPQVAHMVQPSAAAMFNSHATREIVTLHTERALLKERDSENYRQHQLRLAKDVTRDAARSIRSISLPFRYNDHNYIDHDDEQ